MLLDRGSHGKRSDGRGTYFRTSLWLKGHAGNAVGDPERIANGVLDLAGRHVLQARQKAS